MEKIVSLLGLGNQKKKNLFIISGIYGASWIIFHFTVIFFLGVILQSIMLVGFYLGFGAFVAMLSDAPVGVLQKYYKPKQILNCAIWLMLLSALIFMKFIYFSSLGSLVPDFMVSGNPGVNNLAQFFDSALNLLLIIFVAFLYGVIKDTLDVTFLSYILNSSTPSDYAENLSKYNVGFGVGALAGMLIAGIILALSIKVAIVCVIFVILFFKVCIKRFFDLGNQAFHIGNIEKFSLVSIRGKFDSIREYTTQKLTASELRQSLENTKYIFLKPLEVKKEIDFTEMFSQVKETLRSISTVLGDTPRSVILMWVMVVMMYFGFWDTFVATFQVEFLKKILVQNAGSEIVISTGQFLTAYSLLGVLVTPIYLTQHLFIKKSKSAGIFNIIAFGILLSAISMVLFGITNNIFYIIVFGILNSLGYAAAMPLAIATFSERYNIEYSRKLGLREIDSNASAAPYKILMNFANIIALIVGGILVGIMGFNSFFIFIGANLLMIFIYSMLHKKQIIADSE